MQALHLHLAIDGPILCSAALWGLWKLKNTLCFQFGSWHSMETLMVLIWKVAQNWTLLCPEERRHELCCRLEMLKKMTRTDVILLSRYVRSPV